MGWILLKRNVSVKHVTVPAHDADDNAGGGGADVAAQLYRTNSPRGMGIYAHCMGSLSGLIAPISYIYE